jgi:aromatic ring-opening dioxygenase catalytic subunit (LigB family)
MAEIVWKSCMSHTAAMLRMPEGTDTTQAKAVFDACATLRDSLKAARPDLLVIIGTDHMMTFSHDATPIFAIGTGARFPSWGEAGTPKRLFRGFEELGEQVLTEMIDSGFDVVSVSEMLLDHAFTCPLSFVIPDLDVPLLPVYVNCTVPPLPSHARCRAFGTSLGAALKTQAHAQRIAILGTGGVSHWVGTPRTGEINESFDRHFLELLAHGDLDAITALDSAQVIAQAGNGAAEIRNWIVASAAADASAARCLSYEPVQAWKTGIAVVELV